MCTPDPSKLWKHGPPPQIWQEHPLWLGIRERAVAPLNLSPPCSIQDLKLFFFYDFTIKGIEIFCVILFNYKLIVQSTRRNLVSPMFVSGARKAINYHNRLREVFPGGAKIASNFKILQISLNESPHYKYKIKL